MVEEVGRGASSGGKAPILLRFNSDARSVIGLDLGEGVFTGALVNLRGETSHPVDHAVDGRDGANGLAVVESLVDALRAAATGPVIGVGVGTPGVIDTRSGTIRWAVNLDWQDLPLGRLLEEHTGLPVYVANDSQAAALAEYAFGADGPRIPNQVVIKAGKGVGAGIILGGQLYQGDGFGAGEIGHLGVVDDGAACRCGRFGCLETVASADAIVRRSRELAAEDPRSALARVPGGPGAIRLSDVLDAFAADDPAARTAVLEAARALGAGIAAIIGVLDIHRVAIHGSVTLFGERWLAAVRDEAARRSLGLLADAVSVELVRLRSNLTVMGASAMLMTAALGLEPAR
jgi:predicted NBD/HSP70 family sugar kinase